MLTAKDLEKQTRPKRNGAADGKRDFPGTDAPPFASETEQEIRSLCQDGVTGETERFNLTVEKARGRIATARASILGGMGADAERIKASLKGIVARRATGIREAADEAEKRRKDLRQFRVLNDLTYEPDYDESLFNLVGLLAMIVTLEAATNAYFFGEASDRGLAGGFFTAVMISVANCGVGFLTGLLVCRQFNHVQKWRLLFAFPALFAIVPSAIAFNLIVGHYREALLKNPDAIMLDIVPNAMGQLFDIRSLNSIILVLAGIGAFLVAALKGYRMCDPYPGYMRKHWKMRQAEDALEDEREATKNDVEKELGSEIGEFESSGPQLKAMRSALDKVAQDLAGALTTLNVSIEQIEQAGNTTIKLYRSANVEVRGPRVPPPKYFMSEFKLDRVATTPQLTSANDELAGAYQALGAAEKDFQESHAELTRERVAIMDQLDDTVANAEAHAKARAKEERVEETANRDAMRAANA